MRTDSVASKLRYRVRTDVLTADLKRKPPKRAILVLDLLEHRPGSLWNASSERIQYPISGLSDFKCLQNMTYAVGISVANNVGRDMNIESFA